MAKKKTKRSTAEDVASRPTETIGTFFLDSGAHSLFNKALYGKDKNGKRYRRSIKERYAYYETKEFWDYVDTYAAFIKQNIESIQYYANVDVIHNPRLSWKVLKYLEVEHGLEPVPVIHMGTSRKVLMKHLEAGYDYIGLGGVALEGTRTSYLNWADQMFEVICDTKDKKPCVKVHGFAMTAYSSLVRYPWWSVDSTSWAKAGGFGMVYVPSRGTAGGGFELVPPRNKWNEIKKYEPTSFCFSAASPASKQKGRAYLSCSEAEKRRLARWLDVIDIPLGSVDDEGVMIDWGVLSHHAARKIANLKYFEALVDALPEWPWEFDVRFKTSLDRI